MPRNTRTQLLRARGDDEDQARRDREEGYRRLEINLHQAWQEDRNPPAAVAVLVQTEVQSTTYAGVNKVSSLATL